MFGLGDGMFWVVGWLVGWILLMVAFDSGWWWLAAGGGWHLVVLFVACGIKWLLVV